MKLSDQASSSNSIKPFDPSTMNAVAVYSCPIPSTWPNDKVEPSITLPAIDETNLCIRYECEICGESDYAPYTSDKAYIVPSLCKKCRSKLKRLLDMFKLDS